MGSGQELLMLNGASAKFIARSIWLSLQPKLQLLLVSVYALNSKNHDDIAFDHFWHDILCCRM